MLFRNVSIKNFKSYGDYETRIPLNINESRLLLGENGMGKTTFVDAIIWALYGKSLSNVDEIVNRQTKTNCKVEVNFNVGGIDYSIIRYRNHDIHKNSVFVFKDKENISPRTANEVQSLILDTIEINYNAMVSSIIFSSELYVSFLRSKPSDRLKIFENILSLKEIQIYHNTIKEMRKPIRAKLEEIILEKSKCNHEIEFTNNIITDYKEKAKNKLLEFKEKKSNLLIEADRIQKDLETISHINVDEELTKNERIEEIKKQNKEIQIKIEAEEDLLKDVYGLCDKLAKMKMELESLLEIDVEEEKKKNAENKRITDSNANIESKVEIIASSMIDANKIEKAIDKVKKEIEEKNKEINNLKENSDICPTCGQEVDKELMDELLMGEQIVKKSLLEVLDTYESDKERAIGRNKENLLKINEENSKKEDLLNSSKYNDDYLNTLSKKITQKQSDIKLKEQEIIYAEEANKGFDDNIEKLQVMLVSENDLESSAYNIEYLRDIKNNLEKFSNRLTEIENETKVINASAVSAYDKSYVNKMTEKISKIQKLLEKINKKIIKNTNEDNHYDILQQLFSNKSIGVKKYIIDNMLHVFNEKVNFYLPFFFDSEMAISFSKDLEETITINGEPIPFTTFSSGEKTRLELSIAFSLFMVVKTFFSSSVNLLIFDEILDMNLDAEGVESVLNIINSLKDDNSIIVISHRDEYKESFPNQILIKKDIGGFSRLTTR